VNQNQLQRSYEHQYEARLLLLNPSDTKHEAFRFWHQTSIHTQPITQEYQL
jgi:hypothetical protein